MKTCAPVLRPRIPLPLGLLPLLAAGVARAATLTWDVAPGDGGTITQGAGSWTNGAGNWNTGSGDATWNNATPDGAVFGGSGSGSHIITLGGAVTASGLSFQAGPAYTLSGNTLTLAGSSSIQVASGVTATIGSALAGSIGLGKDGAGTLVLSGANGYTGGTVVNDGILRATATGAIPTAISVASGAGFDANGLNWNGAARDVTLAGSGPGGTPGALYNGAAGEAQMRNVTLSGAATIGTGAGKLNVYGTITGGGNTLSIAGTGETNFRPGHSLSNLPSVQVNGGRLRFEGDSAPAGAVTLHVNSGGIVDTWSSRSMGANLALNLNGGTLEANGGGTGTWNGVVTVPANTTVTANNRIDLLGAISGVGTVAKGGADLLVLGGGSAGLGGLTVNAGQVQLGGTANYSLANLNGAGTLNKTGSGTLTITGTAGITGAVTIGAGLLRPTTLNSLPASLTLSSGASLDLNGLNFGGARDVTISGAGIGGVPGALYNSQSGESNIRNVTLGGAATLGSSAGKLNINGTIAGGGNMLTVAGTGETNIRTNNSFSGLGGITVGSGLLRLESTQAPASALSILVQPGASVDTYVSGADRAHGANLALTLNGGTLLGNGGSAHLSAWNGPVSVPANSAVVTNRRVDLWGAISGVGTLTKGGGDMLNIRGGVSSLGGLTVNTGRVRLENTGLGSWTGTVTMNSGTILSNYGNVNTSAALVLAGATLESENNGVGAYNGGLSVTGASTLNTGASGTLAIGGAITGSASLNKTNTGTLQLSGNNAGYGGTLTVSAGVVRPTAVNTPLPTSLAVASGASLDLNGFSHTSRTVTLAGTGATGAPGAIYNGTSAEGWIGGMTLSGSARIGTNSGKLNTGGVVNGNGNTLTVGGTGETNFRPGHSLVNLPHVQVSTSGGRLRLEGDSAPASSVVVHVNSGAIVDSWASRSFGANLALDLNGGTLEANGDGGSYTTTWNGPVSLSANSTINNAKGVVFNGALGGTGRLTKTGAGTLTLANAGGTLTGPVVVNGGILRLTSGDAQSLGAAPGAFVPDQLRIASGTLQVSNADLALAGTRGLTLGTTGVSGVTLLLDSGRTLSAAVPVNATEANVTQAGGGTFNLSAGATYNALSIAAGTYVQSSGVTTINTISSGLQVSAVGAYELNGGTLRVDAITVAAGGGFAWGAGTLTARNTQGSAGTTDFSSGGYQVVRSGTTIALDGSLDTSSGSVLALHGSPSFYLNNGLRFTNLLVSGDLDLASAGDRLEVEISPYLLRPFSPTLGSGAIETGSIPLVVVAGNLTGTFDTFGTVAEEGAGFAEFTGAFSGIGDLTDNTWKLEYLQNVSNPDGFAPGTYDMVLFHYRVTGYVPEPETFVLTLVGLLSLRYGRRFRHAARPGLFAPADAHRPSRERPLRLRR